MARIIAKTDDGEEITDLDHLVGMVSGSSKSEYVGIVKALSLRLPAHLAVKIHAMATEANLSQNEFISDLLEYAANEVYDRLDKKVRKSVDSFARAMLDELLDVERARSEGTKGGEA